MSMRYAVYTRQSSMGTSTVLSSCEAQFAICQDFIRNSGRDGWEWIGERLDDVGETGANKDRPALRRLMEAVESQSVDRVVVYRLDRLTRSLRDSLDILDAFHRCGVELLIVTAPELGSAATDTFLLNMMATFAQFERDMIRSRLADTRATLRRHGRRLAGMLPFGYDADPVKKQLVVNPDEARRVEAIFQMAADGMPPSEIAAAVNEMGWKPKRHTARRTGRVTGGNAWTPRQVLSLLSNPVYLGLFAHEGGTRPGRHQPIVPRELWDLAQAQIAERRTSRRSRRKDGLFWPLRGKIRCPHCGRTMSTHTTRRGNILYRHYRCRSHAGGRPPCRRSALPAHEIERTVAEMLADPDLATELTNDKKAREIVRRFQVCWQMLGFQARMRMLPKVIEEVVFVESDSTLILRLDIESLHAILPENETRDP